MGKGPLPKKVGLQHDFDRLVSKKLICVYQLLVPEDSPTMGILFQTQHLFKQ